MATTMAGLALLLTACGHDYLAQYNTCKAKGGSNSDCINATSMSPSAKLYALQMDSYESGLKAAHEQIEKICVPNTAPNTPERVQCIKNIEDMLVPPLPQPIAEAHYPAPAPVVSLPHTMQCHPSAFQGGAPTGDLNCW